MAASLPHRGDAPRPSRETERVEAAIDRITFDAGRTEPPARRTAPLSLQRVCVAVDGGQAMDMLVAWAAALSGSFGSTVRLVHVAPSPGVMAYYGDVYGAGAMAGSVRAATEAGRAVLRSAQVALDARGVEATTSLQSGPFVAEIVREARDWEADLVVVGPGEHGPVGRFVLGSVAEGVKDHAASSVLFARHAPTPGRILIATDGSAASKRAAAVGLRLAHAWRAHALVLHVIPQAFDLPDAPRTAFARATGLGDAAWMDPRVTFDIRFGHPAHEILGAAEDHACDLVVMGSRGLGGIKGLVAGSVGNRVARHADASVLLVKEALP